MASFNFKMQVFTLGVIFLLSVPHQSSCVTEEDEGVQFASKCEVCKILAVELENRLAETGKSHDVIETGYSLDDTGVKKKRTKYKTSELRLVESLEGICDRILEYNIHKERTDSTRFAKGMSQTFRTLHGLVDKGVKVDLGIPQELWDKPSVEITNMKTKCETLLEEHEPEIEEWYFFSREIPLKTYLCSQLVLRGGDDSCLIEVETEEVAKEEGPSKAEDPKSKQKVQELKSDFTIKNEL